MLGLESLLLAGQLVTVLVVPDMSDPDQPTALAAGLFGLSAMGVQSAFVRLLMRGTPSTNVMTTNTTQVAIEARRSCWRGCGPDARRASRPAPISDTRADGLP